MSKISLNLSLICKETMVLINSSSNKNTFKRNNTTMKNLNKAKAKKNMMTNSIRVTFISNLINMQKMISVNRIQSMGERTNLKNID